mgnify:FL=1|jgi:hypothetical protein|tara:strand:+ start:1264 stop:1437 length:174 start_codon:yes stop_codon:yes gene_type:complete
MSIVDRAYKQVYSSKTPTSRVVVGSLDAGGIEFIYSDETDVNWIIVGDSPKSAEELG